MNNVLKEKLENAPMISNFFNNKNNIYLLLLSFVIGTSLIFSLTILNFLGVDNPLGSEILRMITIPLIWPYFLAAILESFILALLLETIYVFAIIKFIYFLFSKRFKKLKDKYNNNN